MLAHVHVMKTAGQTVREILRQSFLGRHCDLRAVGEVATAADLRWALRVYPGLKSIAGHQVRLYGDLDAVGPPLSYFTFLRDPVTRCVSHFQFGRRNGSQATFEGFLACHADHQTRHLAGTSDAQAAIELLEERRVFVGLMERFNESLVLLERWSGEALQLPYRSQNIAASSELKRRLLADERALARIRECHQQDLELYQYVRDVIYPRQLQRFGSELAAEVAELEAALPAPTILSFGRLLAKAKRDLLYKPLTRSPHRRAA